MTARIDGIQPAQSAIGVGVGLNDSIRSQPGQIAGLRLEVAAPGSSVLGDAAEEIALLFGEKAERKRHEDRIVKGATRPMDLTVERINAYLDKAHKQSRAQALAQAARQLLSAGAAGLREALQQLPGFQQPTERYLLLRFTRLTAPQEGAPADMLLRLDQAIADLETLHGESIQANLLTIDHAADYGRSPQEVSTFQNSLQSVLDAPTLGRALQEVLRLAGETGQRMDAAMGHLMQALGACLAGGAVNQPALLQSVLGDLFQLKSLNTLLESCRQLVSVLQRKQEDAQGEGRQSRDRSPTQEPEEDPAPQKSPRPGGTHVARR